MRQGVTITEVCWGNCSSRSKIIKLLNICITENHMVIKKEFPIIYVMMRLSENASTLFTLVLQTNPYSG